ncbi:hypothetical protein QQ045_018031 [Rhodiola kirilowii]
MAKTRRLDFVLLYACFLATWILVHAQSDQSGFISIDCGSSNSYSDVTTGINYVPDTEFIDSGISRVISKQYQTNSLQTQFQNVRSFPDGDRNCYTLRPRQVADTQYFMRAQFMYGNYDSKGVSPQFDLYIGVNLWDTITFSSVSEVVTMEIIHAPSKNVTNVCLVNTKLGTPFISVLELRLVDNSAYKSQQGTLNMLYRFNLGSESGAEIRYGDDSYDRIWKPIDWTSTANYLSTNETINNNNIYKPPVSVLKTAVTTKNASEPLLFYWSADITTGHYIYLHFAELQDISANQSRQFNIFLNDTLFYGPFTPPKLGAFTVYSTRPEYGTLFNFSLRMTETSTLPPIINAIEVFKLNHMPQAETNTKDVLYINRVKSTYGVNKSWQGDPCAPRNYSWDGTTCSFNGFDEPRIIALNLSFSNLVGRISVNISGLEMLQSLDLSNNNLTGVIPDFLSTMTFLKVLNLTGNNLTGPVPAALIKKSQAGILTISVDGGLCLSDSCNGTTTNNKKSSVLIPVVASVAGVLVLLTLGLAIFYIYKRNKSKANVREKLEPGNHRFTYSQVLNMTNNFERVIGKGGFGTVYHGCLDTVQVAVKMLSPSSSQGYKEFQAEAKLLLRVHHRNLTSLIGYCDEGDKMGLIYEYMSNGNLEMNILGKSREYLTWEDRLYIAVDAAQGLEYLHNHCIPPIVHRDIKSTNILLNDQFQAKLADFGLSRIFPTDESHVATKVVGTPGYLDPDYYNSQMLSERSDVFSFGVVLLEIITSEPVVAKTPDKTHITKRVSHVLSTTGDIKSIMDPRLQGQYAINSAWKAVEIAMACVSPSSIKRPTMTEVVIELNQCLAMEKDGKTEKYTNETVDSVVMASVDMSNGFSSPLAR